MGAFHLNRVVGYVARTFFEGGSLLARLDTKPLPRNVAGTPTDSQVNGFVHAESAMIFVEHTSLAGSGLQDQQS
jgi:hypothetical protein